MGGDMGKGKRHEAIARQTGSVDEGGGYSPAEVAYLRAVEAFKARHRCRFPTAVDLLRVAVSIGYAPPHEAVPAPAGA